MKNLEIHEQLTLQEQVDNMEIARNISSRDIHKKLDDLEMKTGRINTKMTTYANIINALDETQAKAMLKEFGDDISQMHCLVRNLVLKLCAVSQVAWATQKTHKSKHNEILNKLFSFLDNDNEFWDKLSNKTIGQITDILLRDE